MKIKNQFLLSIAIFSVVIAIITVSVLDVEQQTAQLNNQEILSRDIQTKSNNIGYLSTDYFLYQEDSALIQWQTEFSILSNDISKMSVSNPMQQTLLDNIKGDALRLNSSWTIVVSYLATASRNVSVRVLSAFQADWSIMSAQNQALIFDSSQLSQAFHAQIDLLNLTSVLLIFALLALFGTYFIINYLITYRNTLKSISELQEGIAVIGSGNLEFSLKADKKDEISEISQSFNQMTANLKTVTASKTDLEKEIGERKIAEEELAKSEQRWATTLASIGEAVIATDVMGNVTFMNNMAEALMGWTLDEARNKPLQEVFHIVNEETRKEVENPVFRVLQSGAIVGLANHSILVSKEGGEVPIDDSGSPIRDKNGRVTGVVLVFHDITERKKAEEEVHRYSAHLEDIVEERTEKLAASASYARTLIEASLDPLVTIDSMGKITDVNAATEKVTECSRKELVGSDFSNFFTEPEKARVGYMKVFTEGFAKDYPLTIRGKSGKITEILYNASVYRNQIGEIQGVFAAARDVTELMRAQRHAEESAKKLKDAERLAAIGATAGMVGHDIRNPLQAITSDLYLTRSELATFPENEQKANAFESLDEIEKNIDYINKIVADLQDYSRPLIPHSKESDIKSIVKETLAKNNIPKNIKVTVKVAKESQIIMADPDYLKRIVSNLVLNAIQAMPDGGKLAIRADKDKQTSDAVLIVEDTGVGIPDDVKDKLFTPMFTTKSKGQGFGLSVVKRMAEALGGTVTFKSEKGKGTKFIVRFSQKK